MLTTTEISKFFKVNRVTVNLWINSGKLPAIRTLGGYLRVPKEGLIRFLQSKRMPIPKGLRADRSKILLVDDDADFLNLLKKGLQEKFGEIDIETADNGIQALMKVGEFRPVVLVLDIVMPEMDGLEVVRRIKADPGHSGMRVIAMSGHAKKLGEALAAGADAFFSKRSGIDELAEKMRLYVHASS
ncbi:response regulator [bacterium]|nr:response regulator [bacterium]